MSLSHSNPFLDRHKDHGRAAEKKAAKRIGGSVIPGSGAIEGFKGDIDLPTFRLESKSTVKESLSLKYRWLRKISKEALAVNKEPGLVVQFVDETGQIRDNGSYVLISERLFREIVGNHNEALKEDRA